jgi:hypothetical protein
MTSATRQKSPDEIRRFLGGLATIRQRTQNVDLKIAEAARERRAVVTARLDELRPKTTTDADAAVEYQALVEECGRLDRVLALSPSYD